MKSSYDNLVTSLKSHSDKEIGNNILINCHDIAEILGIHVNSDNAEIIRKLEEALNDEEKLDCVLAEVTVGVSNLRKKEILLEITRDFLQNTLNKARHQEMIIPEDHEGKPRSFIGRARDFIAEKMLFKAFTGS